MPYKVFVPIVLFNMSLLQIFEHYMGAVNEYSLYSRSITTAVCVMLLAQEYWPQNLKKYIPLFWYFTVLMSVPTLTTFHLFQSKQSILHLSDYILTVVLLVITLDWLMALIFLALGATLGALISYLIEGHIYWNAPSAESLSFLYICSLIYVSTSIIKEPPCPVAPADCEALPLIITLPDIMFSATPVPTFPWTVIEAFLFIPAQ